MGNETMIEWVKDQAAHESVKAKADGFLECIPALSSATPALDLEQLILNKKRELCLVAPGKPLESSPICFKIIAMNRVLGRLREVLA